MSTTLTGFAPVEIGDGEPLTALARGITRSASKQTYYTIRLLADRDQVENAFLAYAYFRWVDDQIDEAGKDVLERLVFAERQQSLLERCRRGDWPSHLAAEEHMLIELIRGQAGEAEGLWAYLTNMMAVMTFDAGRRGRVIAEGELAEYTQHLAVAVTEALHHFIGAGCQTPRLPLRYASVTGAHIAHMLRDTIADIPAGYINIPREFLESHRLDPADLEADAYREWVRSRVQLARTYLASGIRGLRQVESVRCWLACYAYVARFIVVLDLIERDHFLLRSSYPERRGLRGAAAMVKILLRGALQQPPVLKPVN